MDRDVGEAVYRHLRTRPGEPMTASEVAEAVGCVRRTAHKHLSRLAEGSSVETKKVGARARVWWLSEDVFDRITDAVFGLDSAWELTYLNEQAERLLGRTEAELVGRNIWEAFPEAVGSVFHDEYHRAMAHQEPVSFEEYYPPLDAVFAVKAYPSQTGLSVYFHDVTERVHRERELRGRIRQQQVISDLGQQALATGDVDRFIDHVCETVRDTLDATCCKVLELDPEGERLDLRAGVGWDQGVVGSATVPANTNSQAGYTLQRREPVRVEQLSTETRFSGPDLLTDHGVESGVSVIIGSVDDPWGIIGVHDTAVREFTEQDADFVRSVATLVASAVDRRERERELERYETIFETLSDGVYAVDPAGEFTLVNEAYVEMTGVPRSELLGSHVSRLVDERVQAAAKELETALVSGAREQATLEAELADGDGETFPAEATFSVLETADGYERIGVVRDITERKQYEAALQDQRDRLERLNRLALGVFDALRGIIRAETREGIEQAVCERLVAGELYDEAAVGPRDWSSEAVTTGTGRAWSTEGWREGVPPLVERVTDGTDEVATDEGTVAVALTYDDRAFGALVLRADRPNGVTEYEHALLTELGSAVGLAISAVERKDVLVNDSVARLDFDSTVLAEPFTAVAGADASFEYIVDRIVPVGDGSYVVHCSVDGIASSEFVAAAEAFETVDDAEVVDRGEVGCRVKLLTTDESVVTQFRRFDGRVRSFSVDDGVLSLAVDVPLANVRDAVETVTETYPDLDLRAQRTTHRDERTTAEFRSLVDDSLTERQRAALELAYFGGYFEWPRTTDGGALSKTMDISPPTFHKHLRVAERRVLDALYRGQ
ncbi:PAS domain S-box protein [Salinigranum halophilum]|uniref:PAS domain S-box protein n=1 Tax=Salinigranum halophilum TaxID=2565931 RepID=UPI0010A7A3F0|nr:PAS domain S-box protein [Salinigranum halophilum]